MDKDINTSNLNSKANASDHLANERTFLAWIRTAIGIMAFGFVVVKFSLFVKQLGLLLGDKVVAPSKGYSPLTGIILVALGIITILFAYLRYKRTERQLNLDNYKPSGVLIALLTFLILGIGAFLLVYLLNSI